MHVLVDNNGHLGLLIIDANDGSRLAADGAFRKLFELYDKAEFYTDLDALERPLYREAKTGDVDAMRKLLLSRKRAHAEYETGWRFEVVIDPDDTDE